MVNAAWTHARWVVIALLVSLALNVFLVAMVGGHQMRGWFHDRPSAEWLQKDEVRPLRWVLWRMTKGLDEEERTQFMATIEAERDPLMDSGRSLHEQREAVLALLRAEPFDRAALDAAQDELGRRQDAFHRQLMAAIADAAASLPPESRAKIGTGWD